jgi:DNA-binding IclR family transcriptional regulator
MAVDQAKLDAFMGGFVHDLGAVMHAATVVVGDQLGLYKALADKPLLAEELAQATETDARYVREWLSAQAASGYVNYDPASARFSLSEEQSFAEDGEVVQDRTRCWMARARRLALSRHRAVLSSGLRRLSG